MMTLRMKMVQRCKTKESLWVKLMKMKYKEWILTREDNKGPENQKKL